jgi:hypothetical protein
MRQIGSLLDRLDAIFLRGFGGTEWLDLRGVFSQLVLLTVGETVRGFPASEPFDMPVDSYLPDRGMRQKRARPQGGDLTSGSCKKDVLAYHFFASIPDTVP